MSTDDQNNEMRIAQDVCALPLARRLAAMLDRDPDAIDEGDPLPCGWHAMLFNAPTRQSDLRADGAADLGVTLPDIGLPRLMLGGRQNQFLDIIPIGAKVRRESRPDAVQMKQGRSGRFALVKVEHRIFVDGGSEPAVIETQDYILREASKEPTPGATAKTPTNPSATTGPAAVDFSHSIVPNEQMLFRYSAITDNPHRIHYDHAYATGTEGYPALVVNGSIPAMFLLEQFRIATGREPSTFSSRNMAPMFCGQSLRLCGLNEGSSWRLWAMDELGNTTFDARAE